METRKFPKVTMLLVVLFVTGGLLATISAAQDVTSEAARRGYILIGRPNPSTGPLASFGMSSPWLDERILDFINKDGGIFIKALNKKLPIKIKVLDTESKATKAGEVTTRLITEDKVDLIVGFGTAETGNPASAACERYKVPCVLSLVTIEAWLRGGPYQWSFDHLFTINDVVEMYLGWWDTVGDKINKKVGILIPNDPDGIVWAETYAAKAPKRGYTLVDPGRWPFFTKDFTTVINKFKEEKVDIVAGTLLAPDFATFWRQSKQLEFTPKMASIGKAVVFPADVYALGGDLPLGITTETFWNPDYTYKSSINGESATDLADAWTKASGKQWNATLGPVYSAFEVVIDALKRAQTLDKQKLREAIKQANLTTIVGPIKYNDKNYATIPVLGVQWQKGTKWQWDPKLIFNPGYPGLPQRGANLIFPLPK